MYINLKRTSYYKIFAAAGMVLFFVAFSLSQEALQFFSYDGFVDGEVVGFSESISIDDETGAETTLYAPVYQFEVDENIYFVTSSMRISNTGVSEGDIVPIRYNPNNPQQAEMNRLWYLYATPIMSFSFAAVFFLVGAVPLLFSVKKRKHAKWLKAHGKKVAGVVTSIERSWGMTNNGQPAHYLKATYTSDTGHAETLTSHRSFGIDTNSYRKGQHVTVYMHPTNPKDYIFDIPLE